jgi:hypothetical protein
MTTINTEAALQRLYEDPSLTEELSDEDAKILLDWARAQIAHLAVKAPDQAAFEEAVSSVLRVMKNANRVVGQRDFADPVEQEERIGKMTEAALGMGVVAAVAQAAAVRDQLAALAPGEAIKTLLTLFTPPDAAPAISAQSSTAEAGETAPGSSVDSDLLA